MFNMLSFCWLSLSAGQGHGPQGHGPRFHIKRQRFTDHRCQFKYRVLRLFVTKEKEDPSNRRQDSGLRHLSLQNQQARTANHTQDVPPSAGKEHVQVPPLSLLRLRPAAASSAYSHPRQCSGPVNTQRRRQIWKRVQGPGAEESVDDWGRGWRVPLHDLPVRWTQQERHYLSSSVSSRSSNGAVPVSLVSVLGWRQADAGSS